MTRPSDRRLERLDGLVFRSTKRDRPVKRIGGKEPKFQPLDRSSRTNEKASHWDKTVPHQDRTDEVAGGLHYGE